MLPRRLIRGHDTKRLRYFLAALFLALAVPTAVLIWQAYGQLKWEAFHHYRTIAEDVTGRIDARLVDLMHSVDARSFADYAFLVVSGDPSANLVQRSPLSQYPVQRDLPGVIGYFQVDAEGSFSTPLLPPDGTDAGSLGIGEAEYTGRLQLAQEIQQVLADNRLVRPRPDLGRWRNLAAAPAPLEESDAGRNEAGSGAEQRAAPGSSESVAAAPNVSSRSGASAAIVDRDAYSQRIFDELNEPSTGGGDFARQREAEELADQTGSDARPARASKVSGLDIDADLQKSSERVARQDTFEGRSNDDPIDAVGRVKRKEQIALPEPVGGAASEAPTNIAGPVGLRISTFESEIDPFEFSLLDSGHFVLFRRVWRDDERYIQGVLVDAKRFMDDVIRAQFVDTALATMSSLVVAYEDDVIRTFDGRAGASYASLAEGLDRTLLYRSRLPAPMTSLQLIFTLESLPPGPGARVVSWATLVLAIVFVAGFVTLYQLGVRQIELARQEQDFVSAVSHELRTPLTSIRMYGEMLKEGWVSEEKRQSYYQFIHDESERLSRLISNVLQLARLTRADPQFDMKSIRVGDLMRGIESKITGQVEHAGFELRLHRSDEADGTVIRVDEDCFAQILINLIDNAIKFSKGAATRMIEVSSKRLSDGRVSIAVRDFGPGIPKDQMKKIFQLFYRPGSELTRETVGTGIGLAIVHQLTTAMNGSVELINAEPGAEFRITFPASD